MNCEIESLVDELCEKLKEIKGEQQQQEQQEENKRREVEQTPVSPKEQAEKYYAAFPPLRRDQSAAPNSPSKLIALIPKWIPSPKKKQSPSGARKPAQSHPTTNSRSGIGAKFQHQQHQHHHTYHTTPKSSRSNSDGQNMKSRCGNVKQRHHGYLPRSKRDSGSYGRANGSWDRAAIFGGCSSTPGRKDKKEQQQTAFGSDDQCLSEHEMPPHHHHDEEMNMYDDLPVNIRELLDSPTPPDHFERVDSVEMMNLANLQQDRKGNGSKPNFISCNIISSIWSQDETQRMDDESTMNLENCFNSVLDRDFGCISIATPQQKPAWPASIQNEANSLFEAMRGMKDDLVDASFMDGFHSLPSVWSSPNGHKDSSFVQPECFENEHLLNRVAVSLMEINHNKEKSSFAEVIPGASNSKIIGNGNRKKDLTKAQAPFNPFGFSFSTKRTGYSNNISNNNNNNTIEKEDLLTSEKTHFRPINESSETAIKGVQRGDYADGATFYISNKLDKVNYKRSDSGSLYLEMENGQMKQYWEYRLEEDGSMMSSTTPRRQNEDEFVVKFSVCQNNVACQTDDIDDIIPYGIENDTTVSGMELSASENDEYKLGQLSSDEESNKFLRSLMGTDVQEMADLEKSETRSESTTMAEISWRYENKSCDNCNNNSLQWSAEWPRDVHNGSEWDSVALRNIWLGGGGDGDTADTCEACTQNQKGDRPPPADPTSNAQLREDILLDGEQLLSDLSTTLQQNYREDLPLFTHDYFVPKERKRRHSYISGDLGGGANAITTPAPSRGSWSFASRLEEDCLIQMSTIPTLRSVTL
ncbi:uncharacterized protein LOC109608596 isoform X3 [Aethina tumida]|uniref:uncharacterized protein LOC109608596 isoform X3 n=1 Tax=Aethina tumida TaxID=116153 RepID=UPI002148D57A|nr:uncharacterized protein LOC109608596 isoform X3 [Aethina tumida]